MASAIWFFPGLVLLASFIFLGSGSSLTSFLTANLSRGQIAIALAIIAAIGSGVFLSLLSISRDEGRERITFRKIFGKTLGFTLSQVLIAPLVSFVCLILITISFVAFKLF